MNYKTNRFRIVFGQMCALNFVVLSAMLSPPLIADDGVDFFESRIRPVLVERCYECHNTPETAEAGVALDWKDGMLEHTENGPIVAPGKPEQSVLIKVLRHTIPNLEMPQDGPQLEAQTVADFVKWIQMGAPDPRLEAPTASELAAETSWEKTLEKRRQWWSFQPIQDVSPPSVKNIDHPIDRFIRHVLAEQGLTSAEEADRRTLIRRVSFVLTGLPPSQAELQEFLDDESVGAFDRIVDHYLSSEHFGERWARHWMDLVRYTDSHGSEGDPQIPHAYQYRDYLIRALNGDVPYDQLVREHLAGDLLAHPRTNEQLGINESAIGPAHFRFVFHGFAPTDALDEKVRFTDDQINVVSKAFLGLTVSCARCHDHKFDAISQSDYYAMFGIFASCRPALRDVNLRHRATQNILPIKELKRALRQQIAADWLECLDSDEIVEPTSFSRLLNDANVDANPLLAVWNRLIVDRAEGQSISQAWEKLRKEWETHRDTSEQPDNIQHWNLTEPDDFADWFKYGSGMPEQPSPCGEFSINSDGRVVQAVYPAAVLSHEVSQRQASFFASPRFELDGEYDAWFLVAGGGQPSLRYVVENYPRNGTVYPIKTINQSGFYWEKLKLKYWQGDYIHFELATSKDAPLQNRNQDTSWFAVRDVILRESDSPAPPSVEFEFLGPLFSHGPTPTTEEQVVQQIHSSLRHAISAWRDKTLNDEQALWITACLPLLPNTVELLSSAKPIVEKIRALQASIPEPTRVPGVVEADSFDQPLFVRGNHRNPGPVVARRFLEAIDATPFQSNQSGRLELAQSILHPENPLTSRVIVNRLWHYLFGNGIVTTPDNFGRLGDKPSHPELLDYLAKRMVAQRWSIKKMIRFIVTSETWKMSSQPSPSALSQDPENRYLSHSNLRRLDAESIRDNLLFVSNQLDKQMFGKGFSANGNGKRRSVYITSRRNSLDEFLKTFDSPTPFSTTGRRDMTNVPTQSLTLLNDSFVIRLARAWADSSQTTLPANDRINAMIEGALGRPSTAAERAALGKYVNDLQARFQQQNQLRSQLDHSIAKLQQRISAIVEPARKRIRNELETDAANSGLQPVAVWDFEDSFDDLVGDLHGKAYGSARIEDGALVLDGHGHVHTTPLNTELRAKTLEAWVQLDTLDQGGGGAITVQTTNGAVFDSIVFAERQPRRWMAGSNGFVRTDDLGGEQESDAVGKAVHIAVTYGLDGTIRFYRNGKPYGKPTKKNGLQTFAEKQTQVVFGLRHGTTGNDKFDMHLRGRLLEARLYGRALSAEEVSSSASGQGFVSEKQIVSSLSAEKREELQALQRELSDQKSRLALLPKGYDANEAWARLAHAIFNLKEFIYLQ